jgi:hypothetical protein
MLFEYAVEPKALASSWQNFRYLFEKFGYDTGRVISRFPKDWTKEVYRAAAALPPSERKKIEVALAGANTTCLVRAARTYDSPASDWWVNALAEHRRSPFHGIIALQNPVNDPAILTSDETDDSHPLMKVQRDLRVQRDAYSLLGVIGPLLLYGSRIIFVDPFFDLFSPRYQATFKLAFEFLAKLNPGAICEIHYTSGKPDTNVVEREWPAKARLFMPSEMKATIHCWKEKRGGEDFHARFLGTDKGGLTIDGGFSAEGAHQTTNVQLMTLALLRERLQQLEITAGVYELVSPVLEVYGTGEVQRL